MNYTGILYHGDACFTIEKDNHLVYNSAIASIGHSEKAQEYIYVMQGELSLHTDAGDYVLHNGDSLKFDSSIGHSYENKQDELLTFLVINYYPK